MRSYREKGKVKQKVVHLGEHETAEAALAAWPQQVKELERRGRPKQAANLKQKLDKLQRMMKGEE